MPDRARPPQPAGQRADLLPGLLLALGLAAAAWGLGRLLPLVGGAVFGISLGMALATAWRVPPQFAKGIRFASRSLLQLAVILLGFEINLASVLEVGQMSLWLIAATITAALLAAWLAGRALRLGGKLTALIGAGTAICGASAVAAAAPAIEADERDVSYAVSTIFLFNIAAVFLFPPAGRLLGMDEASFGLWAGTAINDTSSVVAAAYAYGPQAGQFATVVKLTRSLMILPLTLGLALGYARLRRGQGAFSAARAFPWFVVGFLLASLVSTFHLLPAPAAAALPQAGRFLIVAAMAAIGLSTNLQAFRQAGPRALLLGGAAWLAVIVSSLAVQFVFPIR